MTDSAPQQVNLDLVRFLRRIETSACTATSLGIALVLATLLVTARGQSDPEGTWAALVPWCWTVIWTDLIVAVNLWGWRMVLAFTAPREHHFLTHMTGER